MSWPAVEFESRGWTSRYESNAASRSAQRRHQGDYLACVPAVIAALPLSVGAEQLSGAAEAAIAIARFDTALGGEIAPFASVLLRSESAASSRIEQLSASARAIAEAELGAREGSNAAAIIGNTQAMNAAIALSGDLSIASIEQMHHALLEHTEPTIAGVLRTEQVWIGGGNLGPHGAEFVPPHHERVRPALADLAGFMDRVDVPVLVQAAIAHAQFETIHPFVDGNGRTGRALIHALLRHADLTRNVSVPISAGLLGDTRYYFDALIAYREGDLDPIVEQFTLASFAAINNGTVLVEDLRAVRAEWAEKITARAGAGAHALADVLLRQPVVNAAAVAEELKIEARNAQRVIEPLVDAGILVSSSLHKRGRIWRAPEVLSALDAFVERSSRRTREHRRAGPSAATLNAGTLTRSVGSQTPMPYSD